MAGQTIGKVVAGGKTHTVTSTFYGTCATPAATALKEVIINETNTTEALSFIVGMTLAVKFVYHNTHSTPTLTCFNNSGTALAPAKGSATLLENKPIYRSNIHLDASAGTKPGTGATTSWAAGAIVLFVYDGAGWVETTATDYNDNTIPSIYVGTSASAAGKAGSLSSSSWVNTTQPRYALIDLYYTNTAASALTLNVASHGAKPVWLNGEASSATNYSWPHGTYIGYFDGTKWHIHTDGTIPGPSGDEVLISASNEGVNDGFYKIWIEI